MKHLLQAQHNKLEDEMRRVTNAIASDEEELKILQYRLQDQVLTYESGRKRMKSAKILTQQRQVEENVLKLRINQLEKVVKKEEKNIYNSQKFRLELETVKRI